MNQGVEILLSRMDSNPDEFVGIDWPNKSRWDWLLDDLRRRVIPTHEDKERGYVPMRFLNDAEVQALWSKLESLRADEFTKKVMQTLLHEEEEVSPFAAATMKGFGAAPVKAEGAAISYGETPRKNKLGMSRSQVQLAKRLGILPSITKETE